MVVEFLKDERKRFVRQARKHVSKLNLPQAREWEFNWAQESSNEHARKECRELLNQQRGFAGFTQTDEAKRQKLYGDQALTRVWPMVMAWSNIGRMAGAAENVDWPVCLKMARA